MNITIATPEECTLAEWCDKMSMNVLCWQKDKGPWIAMLDQGVECETGYGPSPERAVRSLAHSLSCWILTIHGTRQRIPKLTGIREAGDWERFEI